MRAVLKTVGLCLVAAYGLAVVASFIWAIFWGNGEASLAVIIPLIVALPFIFISSWMFGEDALVVGFLFQAAFFGYCAVWLFRLVKWLKSRNKQEIGTLAIEAGPDTSYPTAKPEQ